MVLTESRVKALTGSARVRSTAGSVAGGSVASKRSAGTLGGRSSVVDAKVAGVSGGKVGLGRPSQCQCDACGGLSNKVDWFEHVDVKCVRSGAGVAKTMPTGTRCLQHGTLFADMFSDCMSWLDFANKFNTNATFRAMCEKGVQESRQPVDCKVGQMHFFETYDDVEIVTEEWLRKRCNVPLRNKLPPAFSKLHQINVPASSEDARGIACPLSSQRFVFVSEGDESGVTKGRIVMREYVDGKFGGYTGPSKFEGFGAAVFNKLGNELGESTGMKQAMDPKASLMTLNEFLASQNVTPKPGLAVPQRSFPHQSFLSSPSGSMAASPSAFTTGAFCNSRDEDVDQLASHVEADDEDVQEQSCEESADVNGSDTEMCEGVACAKGSVMSGDDDDDEAMAGDNVITNMFYLI
jgi:hypothetical protein